MKYFIKSVAGQGMEKLNPNTSLPCAFSRLHSAPPHSENQNARKKTLPTRGLRHLLTTLLLLLSAYTSFGQNPSVGDVEITAQGQVDNYQSYTEITGDLVIHGANITSIEGLSNITSIGGDLLMYGNSLLTNINGLRNITHIGGSIAIHHNPQLYQLYGLNALTNFSGPIAIEDNYNLIDIMGLQNINPAAISRLSITGNFRLTACNMPNICTYLAGTGVRYVWDNGTNCQDEAAITAACASPCFSGGITFITQAQVDQFIINYPLCTVIPGNVSIQGSDITNLNGLRNITQINGSLSIVTTSITNLNALSSLTAINGQLVISYNNALTNITGLQNINPAGIGGGYGLDITYNSNLAVCNLPNFCTYLSGSGVRTITGNKTNCLSEAAVTAACAAPVCPSGSVTFTSQAEIDQFIIDYPLCTTITGSLIIMGATDVTNLNGLSNITHIRGNCTITENPALSSFSGLSNLTGIGGALELYDNESLTSLSGLGNLVSIGGNCYIEKCPLSNLNGLNNLTGIGGYFVLVTNEFLTDLSGLGSLVSIGGYCFIGYNPQLSSLNGLNALNSVGTNPTTDFLNIPGNPSLTNIDALNGLVTVNGDLSISENPALTHIDGLNALTKVRHLWINFNGLADLNGLNGLDSISGTLFLQYNAFTHISGLSALTKVGISVLLEGNGALTHIGGLSNLQQMNGNLSIRDNAALTNISGLQHINPAGIGSLTITNNANLEVCNLPNICTFLAGTKPRSISGNKTTCLNDLYVQAACGNCPTAGFTFTTQAQLNNFAIAYPTCTVIPGNVTIGNSSSDITDLSPLANIETITGSLRILLPPLLTNLNGLNALKNVGGQLEIYKANQLANLDGLSSLTGMDGISIRENNSLTNFNGLSAVTTVSGDIYIYKNNSLTNINGLSALTTVGGIFTIEQNPLLSNIDGLNALTDIGMALSIEYNNNLAHINGLNALSTVGVAAFSVYSNYGLMIYNNNSLTHLNGLSALSSVAGGAITIANNSALTNISALQHIGPATIDTFYGLEISGNPQLAVCNLPNFCEYLSGTGYRYIEGNKTDCLTEAAILAKCATTCPPPGDITFSTQAQIDQFIIDHQFCTTLPDNVYIVGSDITNLHGLHNITTIGGLLYIHDNPLLTNVGGLGSLSSVGSLRISDNNVSLLNLDGLSALSTVGSNVYIAANAALTNVNGLSSLTGIGGYLYVANNPALSNLDGLSNLVTINNFLYISNNTVLTDISGLQHINPAGIGGAYGLHIVNNSNLAVCSLPNFCTYLAGSGVRTISGNKTNCLNLAAVTAACAGDNITPDDNNILYVNINVSGSDRTGNDWANAIPQLADALKWARQRYDTDNTIFDSNPLKIYVANGTYKPLYRADNLNGSNPHDRNNAFVLVKNVHIYGGFDPDAGIIHLSQNRKLPSATTNATEGSVLSGDFLGDDEVTGSGTTLSISRNGENACHVLISAGNVGSAVINGFTIQGGNANESSTIISVNGQNNILGSQGGGLRNQASSPQLVNVRFLNNSASTGGGVFNSGSSQPGISQSSFAGNFSSGSGAGFYQNTTSALQLSNNIFSGNRASSQGGGIFINQNAVAELANCLLTGNGAGNNGSAVANWTGGTLRIYNSTISGNTSGGGAVYNNGTPATANFIVNSIILGNNTGINSTPELQYSLVQGKTTAVNGNINAYGITASDVFSDVENGDYRLLLCSPAINSGNNASIPAGILTDLAGNPRIYNDGIVDMGAYENKGFLLAHLSNTHLTATGSCQTSDGWKNYYLHDDEDKLFISVNTHGQDIGDINVSSVLHHSFGQASVPLSLPYGQSKKFFPFNRSWIIENANEPGLPVSVRFYFSGTDSADVASLLPFESLQDLILYKVHGNDVWNPQATGYKEYQYGTMADTSHYTLGTYQGIRYAEFRVTSFSTGTMAITMEDAVLPLDLLSFTATVIDEKTYLQWHTVNEENVSHFALERSADGRNWEIINTKPALNGIEQFYNLWDEQPLSGTNYYRLKMTDLDGTYKYSKIVEVTLNSRHNAPRFIIYPNPNKGRFIISAAGIEEMNAQIQLCDGLGRLIFSDRIQEGVNQINLRHLVRGIYYLSIAHDKGRKTEKIIIE